MEDEMRERENERKTNTQGDRIVFLYCKWTECESFLNTPQPNEKSNNTRLPSEYPSYLLGPSETGKTTVLKQLKLLYGRKGLDSERQTYRRVVHLNAMKAIQALAEGLEQAHIPLEHSENEVHLEMVLRLEATLKRYSITSIGFTNPAIPRKITDAKAEMDMFVEMVPAIKALWADAGIQQTYKTCTQISIQDSAK
jgi:hypothetical protein